MFISVSLFMFSYYSCYLFSLVNLNFLKLIGLKLAYVIVEIILTILTLIYFFASYLKDPGYLINTKVDFLQMLEEFDPTQLCPDCKTVRTARSRHCSICHKCVERFDHHCPWINNCIGIRNHSVFLIYIICQHILLAYTLICTLFVMSNSLIPKMNQLWGTLDYRQSI